MLVASVDFRTEDVARGLFDLSTHLNLALVSGRRRSGDLKELEFLTLAILQDRGTLIVGDIQRLLGVLPAQMSRIIRALEQRKSPLITCGINTQDKRRIDVTITEAGTQCLRDHQATKVNRLAVLLRDLPEEERDEMIRSLERVADLLPNRRRG
jgi:DNA-binding MarR family transcriptional regulator